MRYHGEGGPAIVVEFLNGGWWKLPPIPIEYHFSLFQLQALLDMGISCRIL